MKQIFLSFLFVLGQIRKDAMLSAACLAPVLVGLLFKFGIPCLERNLGVTLSEYYPVFDLFLSTMAPVLLCFSFAMITLEEIDDKVARYFSITPLGKMGYIGSRLVLPALASTLITFAVLIIFPLSQQPLIMTVSLSMMGAAQAVLIALMVITLSSNKLEGMAVAKLAMLTLLGIPIPFLMDGNLQFAAGFLPSFWVAKAVQAGSLILILPALGESVLMYILLGKRLEGKLAG